MDASVLELYNRIQEARHLIKIDYSDNDNKKIRIQQAREIFVPAPQGHVANSFATYTIPEW